MLKVNLMLTLLFVAALLAPLANSFVCRSPLNTYADGRSDRTANARRSMPSRSPLPSMMAAKNRRSRRDIKKRQAAAASKAPRAPTKSGSDAKWLQVLEETPDMKDGEVKVVSGKYKGEDKFFALATHGGQYFAVSEACGRCKFPMINGKVKILGEGGQAEDIKEGEQQDPEAKVGIACPLCGALFDMRTGGIAGEQPKGLAQNFVSKLVSQSVVESVTPYQAQRLSTGAIVVRVD